MAPVHRAGPGEVPDDPRRAGHPDLLIGHTGRGTALVRAGALGIIAPGSGPYFVPALLVLLALAVPPILTGTYTGVQALDPAIRDASSRLLIPCGHQAVGDQAEDKVRYHVRGPVAG